mgnify:CR=1 FL=1|jgi:hypothetical protein
MIMKILGSSAGFAAAPARADVVREVQKFLQEECDSGFRRFGREAIRGQVFLIRQS